MLTVVLADCIDCARTVPWMMLMMMSMVMCNQIGVDLLNSESGTFDCTLQPSALKARHCYACHHTYISMSIPPAADNIIKEAQRTGKLAAGWDTLVEWLKEHEHAWPQQLPNGKVGVEPSNRSGALASQRAHTLGKKIVAQGWSWKKTNPFCIEMPNDNEKYVTKAIAVNEKLSNLSGGKIPKMDAMTHLAIGGNHTRIFCYAVEKSAPTNVKELRGPTGCMDKERIMMDPGLHEACTKGLRWTVISKTAAFWPGLISFGQRALNADVREIQSEVEIMRAAVAHPQIDRSQHRRIAISYAIAPSAPNCRIAVICQLLYIHMHVYIYSYIL